MEWLGTAAAFLALFVLLTLLAPALVLVVAGAALLPLAHLLRTPLTLARRSFICPFSRQRATVTFLTAADREQPLGIATCSIYGDGPISCEKPCLSLAAVQATPSPMLPRFALLADGAAHRDAPASSPRPGAPA